MSIRPFHVALPVHSLTAAREFYGGLLKCPEGRCAERWVDFNLYGHQFVCHQMDTPSGNAGANVVDGETVPVPHYGVVLEWSEWESLAARLRDRNTEFIVEPCVRFAGQPGEQATLFIADPSGNVLEFKAMRNPANLFNPSSP